MSQEYTVFKKFTAQDYATVPFNANKQYRLNSSSAASNNITYYNSQWTSESVSLYSTASSVYQGDAKNLIKYYQINHLFYKNYKRDVSNRFGNWHYNNQRRELYERVNILSVPSGHYGHSIKKGSFLLSASLPIMYNGRYGAGKHIVIDDSNGNLIISGTNVNNWVTDIKSNILNIGPVKGFKRYDLGTYDGYVRANPTDELPYWRRGKINPNAPSTYTTPNLGDEFDDSYYFNLIKYKDVTFSEKKLFRDVVSGSLNANQTSSITSESFNDIILVSSRFPCINFNGTTSEIKKANDEKFHFNSSDNYTLNFWVERIGGLGQFTVESSPIASNKSYLLSKSTTKTVVPSVSTKRTGMPVKTYTTGSSQPIDVTAGDKYPFEIYIDNSDNLLYFARSDGRNTMKVSASYVSASTTQSLQHITCRYSSSQMEIFLNGLGVGNSGSSTLSSITQNEANLYIGNKGGHSDYFQGSLSQINIYDTFLTDTQIENHYSSSNGSPYVGNLFYSHGIATITHPMFQNILWKGNSSEESQTSNDISQFTYARGLDISSEETNATDFSFNNDGTRLFVVGGAGDGIDQYELTEAFNVTTATHTKFNNFLSGSNPQDLEFSNDGLKVFNTGGTYSNRIVEYPLSAAFDIGTFNQETAPSKSLNLEEGSFSLGSNLGVRGLRFNNDGTSFFVGTASTKIIAQFNLSGAFDIHSRTTSQSIAFTSATIGAGSASVTGFTSFDFNYDGSQMVLLDQSLNNVLLYYLLEPFNIDSLRIFSRKTSTGGPYKLKLPAGSEGSDFEHKIRWEDVGFNRQDGKNSRLYISHNTSDLIQEYHLSGSEIRSLEYQGNHLIYENEYQCTISENEYNDTLNISARTLQSSQGQELANFATGSLFKPYVTTIGLYNENQELLIVGKLGQPIRMSDETDTTFIVRWDT